LLFAEKLGDRVFLELALRINETVWRMEGAFQTVRDFSDRGLAVSPRSSPLLLARALLEYEEGDFPQGEVYMERLLGTLRLTPTSPGIESASVAMLIPWTARITGVMSRFHEAQAAADTVLSSPTASPMFVHSAWVGLALLAVVRGDVRAAQEQYSALAIARGRVGGVLHMVKDRILALLSLTMQNLDQAVTHFENALGICRKEGYRPELAWTCCDYADALLQRNEPGDREKAMSLLDESLSVSSELGMRPLMERVLSRREILRA
jgi:tetratricopeptide (TPR) repeat protein